MSNSVAVIGGGAVGLFCAYYLNRAGLKTTLFERGGEHHDCCSLGNAGMVVPSHFEPLAAPGMVGYGLRMMLRRNSPFGMKVGFDPDLVRWGWRFARSCRPENVERGAKLLRDLNLESKRLYQEFSQATGNSIGLEEKGLVMLCANEKSLHHEFALANRAEKLGLKVKRLTSQDVEGLEPSTAIRAAGGVHFLDDCHLDPGALVRELTKQLQAAGVEFRYGEPVTGFTKSGNRIAAIKTPRGEFSFDHVVVAGGSWSSWLTKWIGFRMPLQGGKGYSVDIPRTPLPEHCYILVEARIAVTPIAGKLRFAGTMEIVGDDLSINSARYQGLLDSIPTYMPDFSPGDFQDLTPWSGLRPCSADGLPYLGRPEKIENVFVATGHSMMGISLAPISGKIVADLIQAKKPPVDLDALRPDRFG
jgi:D-amino-acid dehydrogenase